jgi:hypothetical protein
MPISQYLADANLNWLRGDAFPAPPSVNIFVSLHSSDPGYNGVNGDVTTALLGGRVAVPLTSFVAPSDVPGGKGRQTSNSTLVSLSEAALDSATVTHFGLWSAVSAGNFLTYGLLSPAANFLVGDIIRFPIGQLVIRGL